MAVVIALQLLVTALAGLLLLESKLSQRSAATTRSIESSSVESIDFHPELLAKWDNEAAYANPRPCTRPRMQRSHVNHGREDALAGLRPLSN